jgi:hypothetical protein
MRLPPRIPRTVPVVPKHKRPGDSIQHKRWVKSLPCMVTGLPADDPHHLCHGMIRGMGLKAEDRWCVPLTRKIHDECHASGNDDAYFASKGFDARAVASALWAMRDDPNKDELARKLLFKMRQLAALKMRQAPEARRVNPL